MVTGADKFKFVSPGVQIAEVDQSRLPGIPRGRGPVVIGRAQRGPALRPVTVGSFSEWVEIFGSPVPGGTAGDAWRDGNNVGPTYGAYAAQAWLKNHNNLTYVRLLGGQHQDFQAGGTAGWLIGAAATTTLTPGGAYGLFLIDSGTATSALTGVLAATFYLNQGCIELSGNNRDGSPTSGTCVMVQSVAAQEFKALIRNSSGAVTDTINFNFDRTSKKYIRQVFNTNPMSLNINITTAAAQKNYFLGESYDRMVSTYLSGTAAGSTIGFIAVLQSGTINQNDQRMTMQPAQTGWFIGQDLSSNSSSYNPTTMQKLFQLKCLDSGEWEHKNLKISITDLRVSTNQSDPYGTFTLLIRRAQDSDSAPQVLESFSLCSLNPFAPNYIAKKIGDQFLQWDDTQRIFRQFGNYPNQSRFLYVSMDQNVDAGTTNPQLLPYGVYGPVTYQGFSVISGSAGPQVFGSLTPNAFAAAFITANASIPKSQALAGYLLHVGNNFAFTGSYLFPTLPLRLSSRQGNITNPKDCYFGMDAGRVGSVRFEPSYADHLRAMPTSLSPTPETNTALAYSFVFSLDDVGPVSSSIAVWSSGSRAANTSYTAITGTYDAVLKGGFIGFTSPLYQGFDGVNIQESEPFNNRVLANQTQLSSYAHNSVKRAIDAVADPEVVQANILTVPGCTDTAITDHVIDVCEKRRDMLGLIDIVGGFTPNTENTSGDSAAANKGDVTTTVNNMQARAVNSSFACTYYPWLQARDTDNAAQLWVPPSVAALGVIANTENRADLWIAPAGFTRGGLTQGAAGIPITGVRQKLTALERDKLYAANINPIASFPAEGIVVFGQKTLQVTPSALDRINVRLMLNHIKVNVSRISNQLLFDPNLQVTWDRFKSQVDTFLASIKSRFGLAEFRVILDAKTTTPDLVDRNTMYAKIFLKPVRAIEFIGIDMVISNTGASFAD